MQKNQTIRFRDDGIIYEQLQQEAKDNNMTLSEVLRLKSKVPLGKLLRIQNNG